MNERIRAFINGCFDVYVDHRGREDFSTVYAGILCFFPACVRRLARSLVCHCLIVESSLACQPSMARVVYLARALPSLLICFAALDLVGFLLRCV
jgi:hypothetical protein